jgi:hypothetical protein
MYFFLGRINERCAAYIICVGSKAVSRPKAVSPKTSVNLAAADSAVILC